MPYTAQKPAGAGKTVALAFLETIFAMSWGLLGGAVLLPLTGLWYLGIAPSLLLAVYVLASIETNGRTGPLVALELRQYSSAGKRHVSVWITFTRIISTVILFPLLMTCCITLLFGKRSLPELFTGIKISEIDRRLDPRPRREIDRTVKAANTRLRALILAPLAASAAMFFLNYSAPEVIYVQQSAPEFELPEHEQELLGQYLELTALHPEELEYHVRLASLYYRNQMQQDLMDELGVIAGIDPEHAILLLADTTEFSFHMLEPDGEDSLQPDSTITLVAEPEEIQADSADTITADTLSTDSPVLQPGSLEVQQDTLVSLQEDSLEQAPAESLEQAPADTMLPLPEAEIEDTLSVPEEILEPDTIIQP